MKTSTEHQTHIAGPQGLSRKRRNQNSLVKSISYCSDKSSSHQNAHMPPPLTEHVETLQHQVLQKTVGSTWNCCVLLRPGTGLPVAGCLILEAVPSLRSKSDCLSTYIRKALDSIHPECNRQQCQDRVEKSKLENPSLQQNIGIG